MLSLLRQRLGAPHTLSKVAATNSCLLSTRRSFLTSVPRYEPTDAAPKKTAAAKKPASKADSKDAAKKPAAKKAAKVETPTRPKLTQEDMPPKHPGTAYIIFYTKYLKGLSEAHKPKSLADVSVLAKDASAMWRSFSEAEKQPFVDDFQRARALYVIEHQAWLKNVPSETLAEINRRKVAQGKRQISGPRPVVEVIRKRPLTNFFRFISEFRQTAEAAEILRTTEHKGHLQISRVAGEKWRAMDEDARAPYTEAAKKEWDAFNLAESANDISTAI
ncbi:hypothetical protein FIBSPDRAFT_1046207 [Athelia psychrophila]|uniref:HMG box domain-containing protein n=1 Tax=Athelia psychrophila TaxID=1759441 RepID=A0A166H615_9AGAM|nr:hypothetical protein FIBSPDRAFT_1046207 [Fibularhizoctonia sp. CBS 109695]